MRVDSWGLANHHSQGQVRPTAFVLEFDPNIAMTSLWRIDPNRYYECKERRNMQKKYTILPIRHRFGAKYGYADGKDDEGYA